MASPESDRPAPLAALLRHAPRLSVAAAAGGIAATVAMRRAAGEQPRADRALRGAMVLSHLWRRHSRQDVRARLRLRNRLQRPPSTLRTDPKPELGAAATGAVQPVRNRSGGR